MNAQKQKLLLIVCALVTLGALLATAPIAFGQGCIAVRNSPCTPIFPGNFTNFMASESHWVGSVSYRWLHSDRHFIEDSEQTQRQAQGTEVVNDIHSFDVSATYGISDRWSATMTFPFTYADRSSLYEHDLVHRHTMHAGGLGDIRLVTDYWLLDPHEHMDGNLALGLGVEVPTGDDKASDVAHRAGGDVIRPVDPSIQPGDGGWGVILEMQGFQKIANNLFGYVGGSYLVTPQEQNHTELTVADVPAFQAFITDDIRHDSISDQYSGRFGLSYFLFPEKGISVSLGPRIDGVPAHDLIGGDMGFRRPGFSISVEPGISVSYGRHNFSLTTPVAVYRFRERSAPEQKLSRPTGDSAFADFLVFATYSLRF